MCSGDGTLKEKRCTPNLLPFEKKPQTSAQVDHGSRAHTSTFDKFSRNQGLRRVGPLQHIAAHVCPKAVPPNLPAYSNRRLQIAACGIDVNDHVRWRFVFSKELAELDVITVLNSSNCVNTEEAAEHFLKFVLGFCIVKIHIVCQSLISN